MKTASKAKRRVGTAKARPSKAIKPGRSIEAPSDDIIEMVPRLLRIRHILVPFDFSDYAEKALHYAVAFARQFESKITLLHVCPIPYYPAEIGGLPAIVPMNEPPIDRIQAHLEAYSRRHIPPAMRQHTSVRMGPAYEEICEAARELAVEMIIIATHGRTGFKRALMGSTAERVVRQAPCPVLVVREHEQEFA